MGKHMRRRPDIRPASRRDTRRASRPDNRRFSPRRTRRSNLILQTSPTLQRRLTRPSKNTFPTSHTLGISRTKPGPKRAHPLPRIRGNVLGTTPNKCRIVPRRLPISCSIMLETMPTSS